MNLQSRILSLIPKDASAHERRLYQEIAKAVDLAGKSSGDGDFSKLLAGANTGLINELKKILPIDNKGKLQVNFPTVPAGFSVLGAFTTVQLRWDLVNYGGHDYTEVFRSATNDLNDAISNGVYLRVEHNQISDDVGYGKTYYYWVRHVNLLDQKGPFNATAGTEGATLRDIGEVMAELGEQIDKTQLANELAAEIDEGVEAKSTADELGTRYTVKINNNGHIAGYGLSVEPNNGNPISNFIVSADRFAIGRPGVTGASANDYPFIVDSGNVYMKNAFIKNLSAQNFVAGKIVADDVNVSNISAISSNLGNITAGSLGIGLASNGQKRFDVQTNGTMTIRDAAGNIILSSGSSAAIPVSAVSGLGSLATKSSVSTGDVSGLGSLATKSQVGSSEIAAGAVGITQLGATIQSTNYSAASRTGWRITKAGDATFFGYLRAQGISATYPFQVAGLSVPVNSGNNTSFVNTYTLRTVYKPPGATKWGIAVVASCVNSVTSSRSRDFGVSLAVNTTDIGVGFATGDWQISVAVAGGLNGLTANSVTIRVKLYGYNSAGYCQAYGTAIAITEEA